MSLCLALTPVSLLQQVAVAWMVWKPLLHPLESLRYVPTLLDWFAACASDEHLAAYGAVVDTTGSHSMADGKDTWEVLRRSIKEKKVSQSKG
jgi:hypothetical protein